MKSTIPPLPTAHSRPRKQSGRPGNSPSIDHRPDTGQQQTLQRALSSSPRQQQLQRLQTIAHTAAQATAIVQAQHQADNRHTAHPIQANSNNTGLPDNLKRGMETLSGRSLDHVKVHYNSPKPAALQAHAYAQGPNIHLASGQEKHLPHELGHVVQQMEGRVNTTATIGGMSINDSPTLEAEADKLGTQALQMSSLAANTGPYRPAHNSSATGFMQMRGVTLPLVQQAFGGAFVDTAGGAQSTSNDTAIEHGIKFHLSISKADPSKIHFSYYPSDDDEYQNKILQVTYQWQADSESFSGGGVIRMKWKPFISHYGYMTGHAAAQADGLAAAVIQALDTPPASAPIPIPSPSGGSDISDLSTTPTSTPPGGWPDTPPGGPMMLQRNDNAAPCQRFTDPVNEQAVDAATLKPHEAYYYMNLLFKKQLPDIDANEIIALTFTYVKSGFPVPDFDYSEVTTTELKHTPVILTVGKNGQFSYQVHWSLSKPASDLGGHIVQTVAVIERHTPKGGEETTENHFYQEAWPVDPGRMMTKGYAQQVQAYASDMATHGEDTREGVPSDDEFAYEEEFAPGQGQIMMTGSAVFYDGMSTLPSDFITHNPHTMADTLPSRTGNKTSDLTGTPTPEVAHMIWVTWNSDENGGKTKITKRV